MLKYCIFVIAALFASPLYAQEQEDMYLIDSIKSNNPENLDSQYYRLFLKYRLSDPEKAAEYANLSYNHAINSNDFAYTIRSLNALGYLTKSNQLYDEAIEYYLEAIRIAEENKVDDRLIFLYNNLGNTYTEISKFEQAIENYLHSLQYARKSENINEQAIALNNIGLINYKLGNFDEAIRYFLDALQLRRENNHYEDINTTYVNLALCYNAIGNRQEAINAFNSVLNNADKSDSETIIDAYFGLGKTHFDQELIDEAESYFNLAWDLAKANGDIKRLSSIEYYLAFIQYKSNNIAKAMSLLSSSQERALSINSWERLKNNYELFARIYEHNSDYLHAYNSLKHFVQYKDSIFNEQLAEKFKDAHVNFQESISDEIIAGKDQRIKKNRQFAIMLGLSFFFALIVALLLYRNNNYKRKMNEKLDSLVKERTNELIQTNEKLIKSRKELNNFLYKTSHDIRGPIATLMGLTNLTRLEKPNENINFLLQKIDRTAEHLNEIIKQLTIISHIYSQPVKIEEVNLFELINEIVTECEVQYNKEIQFKINGEPPDVIPTDRVLIKTILYSIINNAYKYSDHRESVSTIELYIETDPKLKIVISDNGKGIERKYANQVFDLFFVADEEGHGDGIGLYHAMLAVERLNGSITLTRTKKPTVFTVTLGRNKMSAPQEEISQPVLTLRT